jgi:hypothetical protein
MPLGFKELPPTDEKYQGHIIQPSPPSPAPVASPEAPAQNTEDDGQPAGSPSSPVAAPIAPRADNDIYDPANPRLAALLSSLPGSYYSNRSQGTYRSPRVNNTGPRPAMLINGQVLQNLVLDCGADVVLVGPCTAAKLELTPDKVRNNAIEIRVASGETVHMDKTIAPVDFVLSPGTPHETTVWAKIIVVSGDLPNTLIGMSVMGSAGIRPDYYKQVVTYYINWWEPHAREARLSCFLPVDYDCSGASGVSCACTSLAYSAASTSTGATNPPRLAPGAPISYNRLLQIPTPNLNVQIEIENARFRMWHYEKHLMPEMADLYERSKERLADPPPNPRPIRILWPLDTSMLDLRGPLVKNGRGLVVVELFSGIMAATEALVRDGINIQQVYACENEAKTRAVAEERLNVLSAIRPEQPSAEAFAECHAFLPQDIKKITRQHIEDMPKPDLVVVGFPCQGFSRASDASKWLRDPRTKLFEEALRVLQLIWLIHGPCRYLFKNVDAIDHPNGEVQREYTEVIQAVLGKGFTFDAVAVGLYAHRNRRWWTNLVPGHLVQEMAPRTASARHSGARPHRQSGSARSSPGLHNGEHLGAAHQGICHLCVSGQLTRVLSWTAEHGPRSAGPRTGANCPGAQTRHGFYGEHNGGTC